MNFAGDGRVKLTDVIAAVVAVWIVMLPSSLLAQSVPARCSYFPNLPVCHQSTPPNRCNYFPNLPVCRVFAAPEIDATKGVAAVAAVLAGLALVRERRTRAD